MVTKPNQSTEAIEGIDSQSGEVEVDSDGLAQWAFTAPFEGIVPHLYLDTRGNVTCGVGFLIPSREALDRYDWRPDIVTARTDYDLVRAAGPGRVASYYGKLCRATLTADTMRAHFDSHVRAVVTQLGHWNIAGVPRPVRVALIDMAFNLGIGGLNKYQKLKAAIADQRWRDAAAECSRRGIQAARNQATRDLFLSLEPIA